MSSAVSAFNPAFNPDRATVSAFIQATRQLQIEVQTITRQVIALDANPDEGDLGELVSNITKTGEIARNNLAQFSEFKNNRLEDFEPFASEADKLSLRELVAFRKSEDAIFEANARAFQNLHEKCLILACKIGAEQSNS